MKITFEIQETELTSIVIEEIKKTVQVYFQDKKDHFIKEIVERETKDLKKDGFFKRQISSTLNKAIYDKVNRELSGEVESRVQIEIEKVFKSYDLQ